MVFPVAVIRAGVVEVIMEPPAFLAGEGGDDDQLRDGGQVAKLQEVAGN